MADSNSMLCNADDSVLLLVDIQTKLTSVMPAKVLDRLIKNSRILVKAASLMPLPIIATKQYPAGLGPIESGLAEMLDDTVRQYEKTCFSCAGVNELMDTLKKNGRKQIVMTGIEAHICVMQSALDLQSAGFQVFVVVDAIASRQRENYENAITRMLQAGIVSTNTESVVFEWLKDAGHESFKTISALIR